VDNIYKVMTGACYNVALTCGYAVFAYDSEMAQKTCRVLFNNNSCTEDTDCVCSGDTCSCGNVTANINNINTVQDSKQKELLIEGISQMFYNSLLCPENSEFIKEGQGSSSPAVGANPWVNSNCKCYDGYYNTGTACVVQCPTGMYIEGVQCVSSCPEGKVISDGKCLNTCPAGYTADSSTHVCTQQTTGG